MKGGIELFMYKIKRCLCVVSVCCVMLSGCASKQDTTNQDKNYYDRAIKASEQAHDKFDRE